MQGGESTLSQDGGDQLITLKALAFNMTDNVNPCCLFMMSYLSSCGGGCKTNSDQWSRFRDKRFKRPGTDISVPTFI